MADSEAYSTTVVEPDFDDLAPDVFYARFFHWEKLPALRRAGIRPERMLSLNAELAGADHSRMRDLEARLQEQLVESADALLHDPQFRRDAELIPFGDGDRVVALGDSITDDGLSWAYLLDAVLRQLGRRVLVVNHGITGHTTQEAISRFDLVAAENPDWVLQMLGTNDARRHGRAEVATTSPSETARNTRALAALIQAETRARLVVMTPPTVVEEAVGRWQPFRAGGLNWRERDIAAVAEAIRHASATPVVDVHRVWSAMSTAGLILPDGVHPTSQGQRELLRLLVRSLARVDAHRRSPG